MKSKESKALQLRMVVLVSTDYEEHHTPSRKVFRKWLGKKTSSLQEKMCRDHHEEILMLTALRAPVVPRKRSNPHETL